MSIEGFRLSPQQRRLWRLGGLEADTPYRTQGAISIAGKLDVTALTVAIQRLIDRHEILRTTFATLPDQDAPAQIVAEASAPVHVVETQVDDIDATGDRRFDFERGPLLFTRLIRRAPDRHLLLIDMPAAIGDAATIVNLTHELSRAYPAQPGDDWPAPAIQYADHAEFLNDLLESADTELGRLHWLRQDIHSPSVLDLPFERGVPTETITQFQSRAVEVTPATLAALESLARDCKASIADVVLAGWQVLLRRLTGEPERLIGLAADGRIDAELAPALGPLTRYAPLRSRLDEGDRFDALVRRIAEATREVFRRQEYFAPEQIERSGRPFFPVCFDFIDAGDVHAAGGATFSVERIENRFDRFTLRLVAARRSDGLQLALDYAARSFGAPDVDRLLERLLTLLDDAIARPRAAIDELEIVGAAERRQLLSAFNDTAREYPGDKCFHDFFAEQAERAPDAVALVWDDAHLTRIELERRANRLAHYLQASGVKPETPVAICIDRSLEMVIGVLGILKSGGVHVPLEPTYPQERLVFMLKDAQVSILLTQRRLSPMLSPHVAQTICLDTDWPAIPAPLRSGGRGLHSPFSSDNLAYIIYTSGSTGVPKGVMISHRAVVNYRMALGEAIDAVQREAQLRATLNAPLVFDASIKQLALLSWGHTLHILSEDLRRDGDALLAYTRRNKLDVLDCTPSLARVLIEAGLLDRSQHTPGILLLGGEPIDAELWHRLRCETGVAIYNHYGPTECTVNTTIGRVEADAGEPTLGRPIANVRIYLLDARRRLVPIGAAGEVCIGGAGLSRGYLNRPDLTAEKFIPPPSETGGDGGSHLYASGDLARYRPDGRLEFLGRIDHQVKIRGFRIELGEIEATLNRHPALHAAVVLAREDQPGDKRLAAYIVPKVRPSPDIGELRAFLQARLPDYMLPSAFVTLDALPLTPNGKIDRRALPAPGGEQTGPTHDIVPPRTPLERQLAEVWCEVLRLDRVGVHDNFFELGGDSLLCIQLVTRAAQVGLRFTPRQLFERQTIDRLAEVVTHSRTIQDRQEIVTGVAPLTPIQHWFFEPGQPDPRAWNRIALLAVKPIDDPSLLGEVTRQLLIHHDALRARFVFAENGWQQIVEGAPSDAPFTHIDLTALTEADRAAASKWAAAELPRALDLFSGPLLRTAFFDEGRGRPGQLLIVSHALAVDGVSVRILAEDIEIAYRQLSRGEAVQLPPKTTAFKHWAERLVEYARSDSLRREPPYWLEREPSPNRLPRDFPDGAAAPAQTISIVLTADETRALLLDAPAAYRTQVTDILLTALVQALARWSGKDDWLIDVRAHGRESLFEDVDVSRTVGWFTTIHPVRLKLGGQSHPGEALKTIKEQLREAPNRGIGYGVLRYLSGETSIVDALRAQPPAELSFNYQGQFDQMLPESALFDTAQAGDDASGGLWMPRYLIEVQGGVAGGRLRLTWKYSREIHRRSTIERLTQDYLEALRALIAHCQSPQSASYTPSDFSLVKLSQKELDQVIAKVSRAKK